ncbi:molecular chaperone [Vibrio sonorensis]|uniref:molecular chaperone n=1 Tax=Vibrio sonorensis TaxID=1004316 RepID=UPI0008D9CD60|nr:molecular chaperone [Vibrio sonorensis]
MAIGFDYGTANCSVAYLEKGKVVPLPIDGESLYISSSLSAPTAESVSEYLFRCLNISPSDKIGEGVLRRAINTNKDLGIDVGDEDIKFGQTALDIYLEDPKDTYYVKSPKSFLGVAGLRPEQLSIFEDLVCAMMSNIRQACVKQIGEKANQAVIGRPVNFLGRGGEESNAQAQGILTRAAKRAGFEQVEFQFEPVAAGLDFEATLREDKNVLVVDIGGGTTDCSMIRMGPSWLGKKERQSTLLGHTGQRVGGNDLDIHLTFKTFMKEFGFGSKKQSGLEMPTTQFWNPIAINDVQAQRAFYALDNYKVLKQLYKDATEPKKLARLMLLHNETLGHALVRQAEQAKIQLASVEEFDARLDLIHEQLAVSVTQSELEEAIATPTEKVSQLVKEAVKQSNIVPDVIYMTGGSARSPILRQSVSCILPNIEIVSGNYFGSVTAGLARWASVCFD